MNNSNNNNNTNTNINVNNNSDMDDDNYDEPCYFTKLELRQGQRPSYMQYLDQCKWSTKNFKTKNNSQVNVTIQLTAPTVVLNAINKNKINDLFEYCTNQQFKIVDNVIECYFYIEIHFIHDPSIIKKKINNIIPIQSGQDLPILYYFQDSNIEKAIGVSFNTLIQILQCELLGLNVDFNKPSELFLTIKREMKDHETMEDLEMERAKIEGLINKNTTKPVKVQLKM